MSLKVNVIYRGIIYRVKGIKVLCSVVLAVIMLLVAIVAMGVWMLVAVYDEDRAGQNSVSDLAESTEMGRSHANDSAPSIDFRSANNVPFSEFSVPDIVIKMADAEKSADILHRLSAPEPNLGIFGADIYNENDSISKDEVKEELFATEALRESSAKTYATEKFRLDEAKTTVSVDEPDNIPRAPSWDDRVEDNLKLPPHQVPKNINTAFTNDEKFFPRQNPPLDVINFQDQINPLFPNFGDKLSVNDSSDDSLSNKTFTPTKLYSKEPFQAINRRPTVVPVRISTQFSHRSGVSSSNDNLTYAGPPVVGYGSEPYKKLSKERLEEYDIFWKTYGGNISLPELSDHDHTKAIQDVEKEELRPHLRGLRPSGNEYDIPLREDAQVPFQDPTYHTYMGYHPRRPNIPPPPPPPPSRPHNTNLPLTIRQNPFHTPNRRLYTDDQPSSSQTSDDTTIRSAVPLFGPLQAIYDYSKRLAASLLSFNTKPDDQIRSTADKLAQHGVKLIDNYSEVFSTIGGPLEKISSLLPTPERLRSLNTFELSLVTWTFLDFWEFLIEKVGTLSDHDLDLLQERLEQLRKRKDSVLTQSFINETMTKLSSESQRSVSGAVSIESVNLTALAQIVFANTTYKSKDKLLEHKYKLPINMSSISHDYLADLIFHMYFNDFHKTETDIGQKNILNNTKESSGLDEDTTEAITISVTEPVVAEENKYENINNVSSNIATTEKSSLAVQGRSWNPLELFSSEGRMQFMQFAVKVVFNFGKVYLRKPYALDCLLLLFCKDLNQDTRRGGIEGLAARIKSVGLKVLTESDQQLRESDTLGEVWRSVTSWTSLQCDAMFPRCDGPKALEIVNEVAMGSRN